MKDFTFGGLLRRIRRSNGIKTATAAEALGVSVATLSRWETDKRYPKLRHFLPLCSAVGATAQQTQQLFALAAK